jgi:cell filamentation protein
MSDKYGAGQNGQHCYPDSDVLINKLGLTDEQVLEAAEIELTQARIDQYEPDFDDISLPALRAIHFYLFQDLYDWAGEFRTVDISKGSTRFANVNRIESEADKLFRQLAQEDYLAGLPREQFVTRLAHYYCELNVIHPSAMGMDARSGCCLKSSASTPASSCAGNRSDAPNGSRPTSPPTTAGLTH